MQNSLLRLVAAIVLAIVAGVGNFLFLTNRGKPATYVRFNEAIAQGATIEKKFFEEVAISGDVTELKKSLIPFEERQNLEGRKAPRAFKVNSLALAQDFSGKEPQWSVIGPFRLISVGERIKERSDGAFSEGSAGQTITIAAEVKEENGKEIFDDKVQKLLNILYRSSESTNSVGRIVAVQIYPSETKELDKLGLRPDEAPKADATKAKDSKERALIIPLSNVESIPEVLARGSYIGFVVKQ